MHLLRTTPGGFVDDSAGVIRIAQTPADIVVLSSADTTLSLLAQACQRLQHEGLPSTRLANLAFLRQPAAIDFYETDVLRHARLIVVDHLGGESYWPYGIERVTAIAREQGTALAMFSGDLSEDASLTARSTVAPETCRQLWRYLREGGPGNAASFLRYLAYLLESTTGSGAHAIHGAAVDVGDVAPSSAPVTPRNRFTMPPPPAPLPAVALYHPESTIATLSDWERRWHRTSDGRFAPVVAVVFYKAHLQSGNTAVFDALSDALLSQGLNPLPIAITSLKDALSVDGLQQICLQSDVALIMNTTAFAAASIDRDEIDGAGSTASFGDDGPIPPSVSLFGDVPVFQLILSGANREDWCNDEQGLRARDVAMYIALPEVDGRIITRAISFKGLDYHCPLTQVDVVRYQPDLERVAFVAELARRWCRLRTVAPSEKRVALIMANYPQSEGRIGNGVGLDTPASVVGILNALRAATYTLDDTTPSDGEALMASLREGVTNDAATRALRAAWQSVPMAQYRKRFDALPEALRTAVCSQWGEPEADPTVRQGRFMIAGKRYGNVFVGIQPPRVLAGRSVDGALDVYASYHDGTIAPPHGYLAFYLWLRDSYGIDAVVHVGKHGNLEWLPGKSIALSADCWPDVILGPMPHLYPFIVNDPGEGSQAKRRTQAVIVDHLMPPLTRAESYGPLQDLERQVDEYYEALMVDPRRAVLLRRSILQTIVEHGLHEELGLPLPSGIAAKGAVVEGADRDGEDALLTRADAYLCELKEAQIRDGLHTFGISPDGRQRRDTLLALARFPTGDGQGARAGLIQALARDLGLCDADVDHAASREANEGGAARTPPIGPDGEGGVATGSYDPLRADPAVPWTGPRPYWLAQQGDDAWRHHGDTRERLERLALALIDRRDPLVDMPEATPANANVGRGAEGGASVASIRAYPLHEWPTVRAVLSRIDRQIAPRLDACGSEEMRQLLRGLAGRFVPPGPSGAPSRGRPDVLPTGRNFYSVDTRALPTQSAWALGLKAANQLVERHLQDHGDFPRAVGLSVWGTATMRTGGDDMAQAFALLGVRPKWAAGSHRVTDFEILPITIFNRPRIDVTLRVSGFFRDAFANLIHLFDAAVQAVAALDEDAETNPIRARVMQERDRLLAAGTPADEARRRAGWRVFGARPGAYGAGIQQALDSGNWQTDGDLSDAYLRWGGHAYGQDDAGVPAHAALAARLSDVDVVVQNRDNREHDVLDSSDYHLFQGGMTATVRHLSGQQPAVYVGDHSQIDVPRIKTLREEIAFVIRSRVVNPKWIDGVKRHGYKGAAELADTVDCVYGYDATARVVSDRQYAMITDAYLHDPATRDFLSEHNPQALQAICERMLEAIGRGLWQSPGDHQTRIEEYLLAADNLAEGMTGAVLPASLSPSKSASTMTSTPTSTATVPSSVSRSQADSAAVFFEINK
jgi:cobaltochelatase CobN